ncbi:hypothetical protein DOTSEDRAFT_71200 [Dothistroma septosporum NZE10]|uniref:Uncharacterized protein n=1 Tax=Dothistroma septosporum (strain NZE10 / CBS 128990) TaxID=675120 RepID=N1PSP8_DOTSN|nr:hypothetical protein DOTSEDRAFT_71200 [Dothistroma septosporum NZE10]
MAAVIRDVMPTQGSVERWQRNCSSSRRSCVLTMRKIVLLEGSKPTVNNRLLSQCDWAMDSVQILIPYPLHPLMDIGLEYFKIVINVLMFPLLQLASFSRCGGQLQLALAPDCIGEAGTRRNLVRVPVDCS